MRAGKILAAALLAGLAGAAVRADVILVQNNSFEAPVVANATAAPLPTDQLLVALFYTDAGGRHLVAQTIVQNDAAHNLSGTHFNDFSGLSGVLAPGDPAVGKQINVLFMTTGAGGSEFD